MRKLRHHLFICLTALTVAIPAHRAHAQSYPSGTQSSSNERFTLEQLLPASVAQNLDVNAWGWFSYLRNSADDPGDKNYWDGDVALGATERIGDRLAITGVVHFVDDNNESQGFIEQAFATADVFEDAGTLITVGKFNAAFGIEPRNAWDRLGGTTSLLFGAEPQDMVGLMITQPIGKTGITLQPFVTGNFDGRSDFRGAPSEGFVAKYQPVDALSMSMANWIGPGFTEDDDDDSKYDSEDYLFRDWQGPDLYGDPGGTLYFADGTVRWMPRPDLTLAVEGLIALNGASPGRLAWGGALFVANYDFTDRWRVFGRWSYLNDREGLVTTAIQTRNELSAGFGFQFLHGVELRGEYRHDFADTGDLDSVSVHITFSL